MSEQTIKHRVVAIGWHCFSAHCKYSTSRPDYACTKDSNKSGKCLQQECPVFKNARDMV